MEIELWLWIYLGGYFLVAFALAIAAGASEETDMGKVIAIPLVMGALWPVIIPLTIAYQLGRWIER